MDRLSLLVLLFFCAGCFGPFRMTGGPAVDSRRWPSEMEKARAIMLRSADSLAPGLDPVNVAAAIAVRKAADQLERASITWRDETLPNRHGNGADLQRNDRDRMSWKEDRRAELEREARQWITSQRGQP